MKATTEAGAPRNCRAPVAGLLCGALLACALPGPGRAAGAAPAASPTDRRLVCLRGTCFEAEIALTAEERARGLMHRGELPPDRGMLFVFPSEGRHRFWMKNTLIALDIIFIGADRRVVSIAPRAQPCRKEPCEQFSPAGNAAYVLEIAGGLAAQHGFTAGDLVEFSESARTRRQVSGMP